ncbi:uncharacterized protein BX664DRAFT_329834 [Halteromyces radiatus]|uniref:uncharacterized protein n=1 Tax=Halteromyces radiatus TaxID=101107 RepID=UPI00221FBBF3|nr:uncharacterized protein BX664DRAFT_329834 [Halteromyces radiatus]KAI8093491.1 hypothetical protein BX664DRAFT_329834 [Halteromyces radiatus]
MDNNDDFNLLDLLERSYHQFDDQNNNDPSSIGIKHKYASSVSTQSTTQSRRPPAPKKRREQHQQQQQQQLQQLQQQQEQQQQHTPLLNDDNVSLSAFNPDHNPGGYDIQPQEQPENAGLTFSPSSFQDSGVSSPDDINEWLRHDDEENILKLMTLQRQLTDLQQVLLEKEQELELYRQYMHFPIQFVKERARQTYDQEKEKGNEIDNLSIDIILVILSLTIAIS